MLAESHKKRILSGLSYEDYSELNNSILNNYSGTDSISPGKYELLRLNQVRSRRIDNTFIPAEEVKELVSGVNKKQLWMIITEPWCGDSAQIIPYLKKIADLSPAIDLRIILRDSNPDIMDLYLSAGTRSIPILIAYDEEWNELFRWGSRPKEAAELVRELKESGAEKNKVQEQLHKWYARNKGQAVITEICEVLRSEIASEVV